MLNKSDPKFGLEAIVERMHAGARRRGIESGHYQETETQNIDSPRAEFEAFALPVPQPITLQPSFSPRSDNHYHVNDLLKYHDRAFLQNAYLAILKRGPDATGFTNFIESLRSGQMNKIDVLARLRYSREGRAKRVTVDGLFIPASIRMLYRVPVLGYLLNLTVAAARLPKSLRDEQQFQAYLMAQQEMMAHHLNQMASSLLHTVKEVNETRRLAEQRDDRLQRFEADTATQLSRLNANFEAALVSEQKAREDGLRALSLRLSEENSRLQSETAIVERRLADLVDQRQAQAEALAKELKDELAKLFRKQQEVRAELVLQGERVTRLLDKITRRPSEPVGQHAPVRVIPDHTLDAFYLALEEQFRGSREEIKQRLRVYLSRVEDAGLKADQRPILDVGCGRGEWLELLNEAGLKGAGVDSNRVLVQECRERNLEAVEADLHHHLRSLRDASLSAVTGFHVIEHLTIEQLIMFLDETVRVVKPGGLLILETPNPENVLVGACNFYLDPTHRNPLPPAFTKFLLESRGFTNVEILSLNPSDEAPVAGDSDLARRFNQYFYGPMDYAVIGIRP
jgi:2-polyprenyl-3-methyl-5-hydroxy-6-metoxy-1,4-benzoquinol methylase